MSLNKLLFPLCLLFFLDTSAQTTKDTSIPQPIGYVNDFERIYTPGEIETLDSLIADYEKKTTVQIAIITIDTLMINKKDFDSWTLKVFNTWGIGQKEKNNGILIGISRGYRQIRIQNGYGIEKIISNQETKEIIDNVFIPFFKNAKYFEGTKNGLKDIMNRLSLRELWMDFKFEFLRKLDIVMNITEKLKNQKPIDNNTIDQLKIFITNFKNEVGNSEQLDSITVLKIQKKDDTLSTLLTRILAHASVESAKSISELLGQLEAVENRIAIVRKDFNIECKKNGRSDLFIRVNSNKSAPKIEF